MNTIFKENNSTLLDKSHKLIGVGGFGFVFIGETINQVYNYINCCLLSDHFNHTSRKGSQGR